MNPAFPSNFENQGYSFEETSNMEYNGYTDIYSKEIDGIKIILSVYMESDFGDKYLLASLYVCKDMYPANNLRHPLATILIDEICGEYLNNLKQYEEILVKAAKLAF